MAKEKKFSVALSTIAGSTFPNLLKIKKGKKVDIDYRGQFLSTAAVSFIAEPFRWWERLRHGKKVAQTKIDRDPVFVIGHWRSGTTHLHNLLCNDEQFAYVTTYQGVFPNHTLGGKWLFKTIMKVLAPEKRPSDNMKLSADLPQEEEFALGNVNELGFYNFWFFPRHWQEYYEHTITYEGMTADERRRWVRDYKILMKKAMINTGRERFISKNPPHTGRIKLLLEAFPNAKFIHIYRNPLMVFPSTLKLVVSTIPPLQFQHISEAEIEENIFTTYQKIMRRYEEEKHLIPKGNLVEVKFEDFEKDNLTGLKNIYEALDLPGFDQALPHFKNYIDSQKRYRKNNYRFSKSMMDKVEKRWGFAMKQYGYDIPSDIEVIA